MKSEPRARNSPSSQVDETAAATVAIVHLDMAVPKRVVKHLEQEGYAVEVFVDVPSAAELGALRPVALIVSMYASNDESYVVCGQTRKVYPGRIGVLLHSPTADSVVEVFRQGADAVWCYPVGFQELLARIRALLRRTHAAWAEHRFRAQPLAPPVTVRNCEVQIGEKRVRLSKRECQLLQYLFENANRTVGASELLKSVWHDTPNIAANALNVTLHRLRAKIEADPADPCLIVTVTGKGYRFVYPIQQ